MLLVTSKAAIHPNPATQRQQSYHTSATTEHDPDSNTRHSRPSFPCLPPVLYPSTYLHPTLPASPDPATRCAAHLLLLLVRKGGKLLLLQVPDGTSALRPDVQKTLASSMQNAILMRVNTHTIHTSKTQDCASSGCARGHLLPNT
jgi:hypothetical protein